MKKNLINSDSDLLRLKYPWHVHSHEDIQQATGARAWNLEMGLILKMQFRVISVLVEADNLDEVMNEMYRNRKAESQGWKPVSRCN